jgi:hypothetical protein
MIKDKKYSVDMDKFMAELRRGIPRCRECTARKRYKGKI